MKPSTATAPVGQTFTARRASAVFALTLALLVVAAIVGIGVGSHPLPANTVLSALVSYDPNSNEHLIVVQSRLPRILMGVVVGAALGLAGVLMQSVTRNPLADPGVLGINAGASLTVVIAISVFGVTAPSGYLWFAFLGAALAAVVVYALGSARGSAATPVRIALAGTAVSIVIGSLTQVVILSDEAAFNSFRFWAVGSLQGRGFDVLATVLPFIVAAVACTMFLAAPLNAIALGDDVAASLGTRVAVTRIAAAIAVVILAGAATAAAGPIGFIGLGAAHIARFATGNEHRLLLPLATLVGATLLVVADTLGRWLVSPAELQTGIAAALFGGPVFIALVRSRKVSAL